MCCLGLYLRVSGISKGLSYWNDEDQVALMARGILSFGKPVTAFGYSGGIYQLVMYYLTALFFKLFGPYEWAGRIPSVIAGLLLSISGFAIGKKLFNSKVAFVISTLLCFSQIQLAWSTQLRPYIWLELFTLWTVYFLHRYLKYSKTVFDKNIVTSIIISGSSVLFHGTGLLNVIILSFVLSYKIVRLRQFKYLLFLPLFAIMGILVLFNSFSGGWEIVSSSITRFYFSPLHYRIFLTHNYLWLVIGSILGFIIIFKKDKEIAMLWGGSIFFIFTTAIFKINPNYVRYSLPAFPLMYVLFAKGIVTVIEKTTKQEYLRWSLVLLTFILLSFTGKFVFWPKYYYSINADMRENPIVDYKLTFHKIKDLIKDKKDIIVMDAWNDRVPWYLPDQKFILLIKEGNSVVDPVYGEKMMGTIEEFEIEKNLYKSGVVVVEDWQSQTPEDLKGHIRKNLKFEFTVQDLPYNENDHWGISVYSWGI